MVVYYGRRVTGPEPFFADFSAGQMRASVYNALSQNMWVRQIGGWVGDPDDGAAPTGRFAGYETDASKNPTTCVGTLVAGVGFGGALLVDAPAAGVVGLGLLGAGISYLLPLIFSAAGSARGEIAAAAAVVARVSTLGYLGSFVGPALSGIRACLRRAPALSGPWHAGCGRAID